MITITCLILWMPLAAAVALGFPDAGFVRTTNASSSTPSPSATTAATTPIRFNPSPTLISAALADS